MCVCVLCVYVRVCMWVGGCDLCLCVCMYVYVL